ncbi:MAG: hypothetical protein KDD84_12415 [Caldilineaceae bacterium]|nr:hypothetical protein [Caldilineaceae bacterium]
MAYLATKPYLAASLNIMVAARAQETPQAAFTEDEIVEILLAMAENDSLTNNRNQIEDNLRLSAEPLYPS